MSVEEFPDTFYALPLPSSGTICNGGSFTGATGELKTITCWVQVRGTSGGSETFTLGLYPNDDFESAIASSAAVAITSFGVQSDGYNYVRFDFSDVNLNANNTYHVGISSANYTRNADTYFVGFLLDWPDRINATPSATSAGLKMAIVTEQ